jgi:TonB family protein
LEALNSNATAVSANGATQPVTDVPTASRPLRISTGVVWPKLISESAIHVSSDDFMGGDLTVAHMIVAFTVDENGKPQNVHLLRSVNPMVDERVIQSVRLYRFEPATLNNQKIAVDVNMRVNFARQ